MAGAPVLEERPEERGVRAGQLEVPVPEPRVDLEGAGAGPEDLQGVVEDRDEPGVGQPPHAARAASSAVVSSRTTLRTGHPARRPTSPIGRAPGNWNPSSTRTSSRFAAPQEPPGVGLGAQPVPGRGQALLGGFRAQGLGVGADGPAAPAAGRGAPAYTRLR